MYCRICGSETSVKFYPSKKMALCHYCSILTPKKASRENFLKRYFGKELKNVPTETQKEFYSDYLMSIHTVESYIRSTVSEEY